MTKVDLPYIQHFTDRHGHERFYFRRQNKRAVLPGPAGSDAFMAAYNKALAESETPKPAPRPAVRDKSFRALAAKYYASPKFLGLSATARKNYRSVIDRFLAEHGDRLVAQMKREHVDSIIGKMADRPGAAIVRLKRLRTLIRYAIDIEWIDRDPTAGAIAFKSKEIHTWTEDEVAQYEARWEIGTKPRLAFAMLLFTGQRVSDAHDMVRPASPEDTIRVSQQKTGESLELAIHPEFWDIIEATPSGQRLIIATEYGKPFSVKGFGNFVSKAIRAAGLPGRCKAHGLRKAAARRLAEVGCSTKEIQSVTGHRTLAEIERYTRAAEQKRLNAAAMRKQVGNRRVSTLPIQSVNPIENIEEK